MTSLSDAAAESLSKHEGDFRRYELWLLGLTSLSDAAAESLSKRKAPLRIIPDNLPESAADILEKVLTKEIAEQFLAANGAFDLCEFTSIEDDAVETLSKYEVELQLRGLTSLSDAAAKSLSK